MFRRVLSMLRRQPALGRAVLAGTAALGLALACLNPQNDDLPSNNIANPEGAEPTSGNGQTADDSPASNYAPETPGATPAPQGTGAVDALPPPANADLGPADEGGVTAEPDAGADADAAVPNVAP